MTDHETLFMYRFNAAEETGVHPVDWINIQPVLG
jgi:hypothetical protein